MREDVLRSLATRAVSDRAFLSGLRKDPRGTLVAHGYDLSEGELAAVLDLQRRTAGLGDGLVAALISGGLGNRANDPPQKPRAPGAPGPGRPDRPGGPARGDRPREA